MYHSLSATPKTVKFFSTDTRKEKQKNLALMPSDWIYHTKDISYNFNSDGYREKEFDAIKWKDSIVLYGCSHLLGVGLANQDTLARQLEDITNIPCVNMGVNSSSALFNLSNMNKLHEAITPQAVVVCWPDISRSTLFKDIQDNGVQDLTHIGAWFIEQEHRTFWTDYVERFSASATHNSECFLLYRKLAQLMWQQTTFVEITFASNNNTDIKSFTGLDYARDRMHYGVYTMNNAASYIAQQIFSS